MFKSKNIFGKFIAYYGIFRTFSINSEVNNESLLFPEIHVNILQSLTYSINKQNLTVINFQENSL